MPQAAILNLFNKDYRIQPLVGMGATYIIGTDSYPYSVVSVSKDSRTIEVIEAEKELVSDESEEEQQWKIKPIYKGYRQTFTLRKNNKWVEKGCPMDGYGEIILGTRKCYQS